MREWLRRIANRYCPHSWRQDDNDPFAPILNTSYHECRWCGAGIVAYRGDDPQTAMKRRGYNPYAITRQEIEGEDNNGG